MKIPCLAVMMAVICSVSRAAELPRSNPEAQGISSAAVLSFIEAVDAIDSMNSFMLVRHGQVVAEGWWSPYRAEARHSLYSLSKSFTSTAVGLAIAEGKLSLDDEVLKFFPDDAPSEPSNNLKSMRVSDLLRMSTGHQIEPSRTPDVPWTKTFLGQPVPFKPGTHFLYNTSATYMQSAIVQKATGQTVLDYLQARLFAPLGIEQPTWETSPQGISTGGYGLSIRTEDIAKFGQLYLQKGKWHDKQLVPAAWIEAATARQTSNGSNPHSDWDQGYGYQFWRCRHGAYRGDGAFGQYCIVLPEQDAVIAITSGVRDMQGILNLVWEKLLPAMQSSDLAVQRRGGSQAPAKARRPARAAARKQRRACEDRSQELFVPRQRSQVGSNLTGARRRRWPRNARCAQRRGGTADRVRSWRVARGTGRLGNNAPAAGSHRRRLDERHIHSQDLLLRNAVYRHGPFEVLGGRAHIEFRIKRRIRADQAAGIGRQVAIAADGTFKSHRESRDWAG